MVKNSFEEKIVKNLADFGIRLGDPLRFGVAVSGGADSVSLLAALSSVLKPFGLPLFVINVNHNIREEAETCGDSLFVRDLCRALSDDGCDIRFSMREIEKGKIAGLSQSRDGGIEEAARFCRYQIFEDFIKENNLDFLCLAHNQNDNLETLLMRFLQGAFTENYGIAPCRGKFIRPLLNVARSEIEEYLKGRGLTWRTDSTNADDSYLRNNIRLNLMPLLDGKFAGWKTAVLNGLEKARMDGEIIEDFVEKRLAALEGKIVASGGGELSGAGEGDVKADVDVEYSLSADDFLAESASVQIRLLTKLICRACGEEVGRIPFSFLKEVCAAVKNGNFVSKIYKNALISFKNKILKVKNSRKIQTDFVFSAIIEEEGTYAFHFGEVEVVKNAAGGFSLFFDNNGEKKVISEAATLPLCVRSFLFDDKVLTAEGGMKSVSDVLSSWHVPEAERGKIPVIQLLSGENQRIICIFGQVFGFDNWIVK